ncbi:MAG: FAD-dependent oxidoreductase, partial [Casimicrobiaceae bacterium]
MRVIILGAGLMGVTSAHALWREGHEVVVIERADRPAAATSRANAGLIAASRALPWPAPGVWRTFAQGFVTRNAPWRIERPFDPAFWRWGARFLALSNPADHERLARAKLACAAYAHRALRQLITDTGIDCGYRAHGLIYVCRSEQSRVAAQARADQVARHGVRLALITARQAAQIEPS